jgi:hypothetical protein
VVSATAEDREAYKLHSAIAWVVGGMTVLTAWALRAWEWTRRGTSTLRGRWPNARSSRARGGSRRRRRARVRAWGGDRYGVNFQDHQGEDPHEKPRTGVAEKTPHRGPGGETVRGKTSTRGDREDLYGGETVTGLISEGRGGGTLGRRHIDTAHVTSVGRFTSR